MNNCGLPFEYEYPYLVGPYAKEHKIPVALTLELTPFCNFSCVMCYVRLSEKQARVYGSMMTAEQILDIAEQAKECGTIYLCLTGGEPLSRPDFWDIYKELNKMGFVISLLSNGSLIDEKAIEKFREYGMPSSVKISLYGASNETYKKVCGVDGGFTATARAIELLKKEKVPLALSATIVRENADDIIEMYRFAAEHKVPFSHTVSVVKSVRGCKNSAEASRFMFGEFAENLTLEQLEKHKFRNPESPFSWCANYGRTAWITWNGHMQLCAFMNGPYSVLDDGFKNAWREIIDKLDALKNPEECKDCKYGEFCQRCPGLLCAESGDAQKVSASVCDTAKRLYEAYNKKIEEERR